MQCRRVFVARTMAIPIATYPEDRQGINILYRKAIPIFSQKKLWPPSKKTAFLSPNPIFVILGIMKGENSQGLL